jgi:hypothetical protein
MIEKELLKHEKGSTRHTDPEHDITALSVGREIVIGSDRTINLFRAPE